MESVGVDELHQFCMRESVQTFSPLWSISRTMDGLWIYTHMWVWGLEKSCWKVERKKELGNKLFISELVFY